MKTHAPRTMTFTPLSFFLGVMLYFVQGCGVVGPPLAPEDIGIEAKIRAQQKAKERASESAEEEILPIDQEEASLPPLKPIGAQ
jgi:hypothetical protein